MVDTNNMGVMSNMVDTNNLGVMSNNMRAVMDLLMCFFTVGDDYILTLLNVGDINNNIILNMALLVL